MPSLAEVQERLYGAWRFARLDRGALRYFDCSLHGAIRSFWAAALAYPGFLLLLVLRLDAAQLQGGGLPAIVAVETIGYVIGWAAYPLAALPFCRWLAPEERALGFIAAYNWCQVIQMAALVPLIALVRLGPFAPDLVGTVELVAYLVMLAYEGFIAWAALEAGAAAAFALVLLDFVLGAVLTQVTLALYPVLPGSPG